MTAVTWVVSCHFWQNAGPNACECNILWEPVRVRCGRKARRGCDFSITMMPVVSRKSLSNGQLTLQVFFRLQSRQREHLTKYININTVVILSKHTCISHSWTGPSGQQYQTQFCWLIKSVIPQEINMARSLDTRTEWETIQMLITSYQNTYSDLYPSDKGVLSSGST